MIKTLFSFSLVYLCACTNRTDLEEQGRHATVRWNYLTIQLNDTVIKLTQSSDTLEVETLKGGIQPYPINITEKDSLFAQADNLLDFKGRPRLFCTDYVGKLKVRIVYNEQLKWGNLFLFNLRLART